MTATVLLVCLMLGGARALVDLNCSDNATCIEAMGRDLVKSLREQKAVRLFELVTIEPLQRRQGRSSQGLWGMMENHALSFDWSDFTFRLSVPEDGRDDALDLEMYENRSVKDEVESSPKKSSSSSKVEEEKEEDKTPKMGLHGGVIKRRRRRQKKKVMQALIPLLFGMKSAGAVIFAFSLVTVLTMKAFIASKMALAVTIGMALKRLYETYSTGVGFQNHPYLYSQYPIDFPSASSHAYSVSGVSPQFASNEMYNPNMLGPQDLLQQQDASAQQSQQVPLLVNSTNASERWDGKSKLQKLLEPFIDGFKNVINPIANIFYGAMPTFRGLNTEVSSDKSVEVDGADEVIKTKEILVPQPRFIAQRKNFVKLSTRPKKYSELKIDLDRLKRNKDFQDYIKTKKYKHNYPSTFYYPRVKYVLYNPNMYYNKPNNSRLLPYSRQSWTTTSASPIDVAPLASDASEWKPIVVFNTESPQNNTFSSFQASENSKVKNNKRRRFFRKNGNLKRRKRIKRDVSNIRQSSHIRVKRGFTSIFDFITEFLTWEPVNKAIREATKSAIQNTIYPEEEPPLYYTAFYNSLMLTMDVIDGLFSVQNDLKKVYFSDNNKTKKRKNHKLILRNQYNKQSLEHDKIKTDVDTDIQSQVKTIVKHKN